MKLFAMKHSAMKLLTMTAAMLALTAMPGYAQMGGGRHHSGDDNKKAEPVKKIDEKAYKAALERIPEPTEKYDPWGVTKPAGTAKDAAKDTAKKPKTP
jgi:hypothetical protein